MFLFCNPVCKGDEVAEPSRAAPHSGALKPTLNIVEESLLGKLFGHVSLEGDSIGKEFSQNSKHVVIVGGDRSHRRVKTAETLPLDEDFLDCEQEWCEDSLCYSTEDEEDMLEFEKSSDWLETAAEKERARVLAEYRRQSHGYCSSDDEEEGDGVGYLEEGEEVHMTAPAEFILVPHQTLRRDVPPHFQVNHDVRYLGQCEDGCHFRVLETTWTRQQFEKVANTHILGGLDLRYDVEVHRGQRTRDGTIQWSTVSNHSQSRRLHNIGTI